MNVFAKAEFPRRDSLRRRHRAATLLPGARPVKPCGRPTRLEGHDRHLPIGGHPQCEVFNRGSGRAPPHPRRGRGDCPSVGSRRARPGGDAPRRAGRASDGDGELADRVRERPPCDVERWIIAFSASRSSASSTARSVSCPRRCWPRPKPRPAMRCFRRPRSVSAPSGERVVADQPSELGSSTATGRACANSSSNERGPSEIGPLDCD
jgi:hypothetical protein